MAKEESKVAVKALDLPSVTTTSSIAMREDNENKDMEKKKPTKKKLGRSLSLFDLGHQL